MFLKVGSLILRAEFKGDWAETGTTWLDGIRQTDVVPGRRVTAAWSGGRVRVSRLLFRNESDLIGPSREATTESVIQRGAVVASLTTWTWDLFRWDEAISLFPWDSLSLDTAPTASDL